MASYKNRSEDNHNAPVYVYEMMDKYNSLNCKSLYPEEVALIEYGTHQALTEEELKAIAHKYNAELWRCEEPDHIDAETVIYGNVNQLV